MFIEDLQNQLMEKEEESQENGREFANKIQMMSEKEMEKDDLIRELKLKLEAAPEDITVPIDASATAEEAEKTKLELNNLMVDFHGLSS